MKWIKRLFKFRSKIGTENIVWRINPNGMTYHEAMLMTRKDWRVRNIEWPAGEYVELRSGIRNNKLVGRLYKCFPDGLNPEYVPTISDQYGGCGWQICGKVDLKKKIPCNPDKT